MRMAMIAMTTKSSISVNACADRGRRGEPPSDTPQNEDSDEGTVHLLS